MIDVNQLIFIGGLVVILLFAFVFPIVFQNKYARVSRYFRQNTNIRFQLVRSLSQNISAIPNDLSQIEMVAILTFICVQETVSDSYSVAQKFSTIGWQGKYNDEFFDRLGSTARAFSAKRWNRESIDLFRLGQMIAQLNNNSHWAREFAESVQRLQYRQVQSGLPTKLK